MNNNEIVYVGVNDHNIDLFEGQYKVPKGISYNSYVILDEKIAVIDSVDLNFKDEWLNKIDSVLNGMLPNYLIVQHMEPDHSANIMEFIKKYPNATVVGNVKTLKMIQQFFNCDIENKLIVAEGDKLSLGKHELSFIMAPMVHWPEVMFTYDSYAKALFSADAFGKFGALDIEDSWEDEARRYYIGIVGKYGVQVQAVLKKASNLDIQAIYPLHGPVLSENLAKYLNLYNTWSKYEVEEEGIVIAYTSIYGNTKNAVLKLALELRNNNQKVLVYDLARTDMSFVVSEAFKYSKLVLATTTYNGDIFPFMREFIDHLVERNYSNRTVGFIENGTWGPIATKIMKQKLEKCKNLNLLETNVKILSALNEESIGQLLSLSKELL